VVAYTRADDLLAEVEANAKADYLNAKYGYDSGRLAKSPFNKRFEDLVSPSGVGVG
jgi:hypothetical protein